RFDPMQVVADALTARGLPRASVATIGNYDGIHIGQRAVLRKVVERSRAENLPSVVVTFEPHPLTVLSPAQAPPRLLTVEQKARRLGDCGIDVLAVIPFTELFAATTAEAFVREVLVARVGIRELYVGRRFAFGSKRSGNLELLARLGEELGYSVVGLDEERIDGEAVSSTRIRQAIAAGEVEAAARLLGRPYSLTGEVVAGARRGRTLGFPTANLAPDGQMLPSKGVYATRIALPGIPEGVDSVTNIGVRPTVGGDPRCVVETHLLDFDRDLYGARVELHFHRRLRNEMLFPSVADLAAQIGQDVVRSREYFSAFRGSTESRSRFSAD
ncbi:MAG: bifunctional riboflavin kinase/FAD synthetase, partial [Thermoanaerobaculia bacterium]